MIELRPLYRRLLIHILGVLLASSCMSGWMVLHTPLVDEGHFVSLIFQAIYDTFILLFCNLGIFFALLLDKEIMVKFIDNSRVLVSIIIVLLIYAPVALLARFHDMALKYAVKQTLLNQSISHLVQSMTRLRMREPVLRRVCFILLHQGGLTPIILYKRSIIAGRCMA